MKRWIKYEKIKYYYLFFQYRNYLLSYSFLQHVEHITGTRRINAIGHTCGSAGKQSACNAGDLSSTPGLGRSPGEGKGYPLQYSGLKIFMDYTVYGIANSQTRLNDFHFQLEMSTTFILTGCCGM